MMPQRFENNKFLRVFLPIYLIVMVLLYSLYLFLEKYRLEQAKERLPKGNLTEQDMILMDQLGKWPMYVEGAFFFIFIVTAVYLMIKYRKNRRHVTFFLVVNGFLFGSIYLLSFGLSRVLAITVGNVYQPIIVPTQFLIFLLIYTLLLRRRERQDRFVRQFDH